MSAPNYDKPVNKLSRKQLEAEALTIDDIELSRHPKLLEDSGLRSAVRLHRRRMGTGPV